MQRQTEASDCEEVPKPDKVRKLIDTLKAYGYDQAKRGFYHETNAVGYAIELINAYLLNEEPENANSKENETSSTAEPEQRETGRDGDCIEKLMQDDRGYSRRIEFTDFSKAAKAAKARWFKEELKSVQEACYEKTCYQNYTAGESFRCVTAAELFLSYGNCRVTDYCRP